MRVALTVALIITLTITFTITLTITLVITLAILALALLACNTQGIMYLTSGTDSYGKGLSYPGYRGPPAIASFVSNDHTSQLAPVFLGRTQG